jgi:hypothetical protein
MQKWKYTSYEDGREVTRTGLSHFQAVSAIERAMVGADPFPEDKAQPQPVEQREDVTVKELIAA